MRECPTCHREHADEILFCPYDGVSLYARELAPGSVIRGKYELQAEIGRGGMGVVFRARHLLWNEPRAIKILLEASDKSSDMTKSFLGEALVLRQFKHPNIVRVEDVDFTEHHQLFVVMEFIQGEDLRKRLRRSGPLSEERAVAIAMEACEALDATHRRGIIHRDVKPHNILLAADSNGTETVKLIDFGIAKIRPDAHLDVSGMISNPSGMFVGTPDYASPEQAIGMRGSELDGRSDLYSLGLVLYEMLTGELPFSADSPLARLVQRQTSVPPPPERVRPDLNIGARVSAVVMKALQKDRTFRFSTAVEMRTALAGVREAAAERPNSAPIRVFTPKPREASGELLPAFLAAPKPRWRPHPSLIWSAVALIVVLGFLFVQSRVAHKAATATVKSPEIHYFRASPDSVRKGGFAVLSWEVVNASQVVIEPGIGAVPSRNFRTVSLSRATTFTISAKSWSAEIPPASQSVQVKVE
jgi:serine/threonine-protein kinase